MSTDYGSWYTEQKLNKEGKNDNRKTGNGSLLISDTVGNDWIKKVYYFYSKKEAIKLFREYRREVKNEKKS
jgi:hypothetical protein